MNDQNTKKVLCENLELCCERASLVQNQYSLCAESLAEEICLSFDGNNAASLYEDFKSSLPINNTTACAIFCNILAKKERISSRNKCDSVSELFGMNQIPSPGSHGKISFVRNKYNEAAYEKFSNIVSNTKFLYASSFASACEDVINGVSEYAIFPIENSSDGRLFGFYSLLDRFELRICAVTEIETDDDSTSSILFALVGKTIPKRIRNEDMCDMEFSIARGDSEKLVDFLHAASAFSAALKKIDTVSLEYDHDLYKHYFTFSIPCEKAFAFAIYLSFEYPNYIPIGFYQTPKNI